MTTFKDIGLDKALLDSVTALGFENPTPVQELAIPQILKSDEDLIALAQTGTGKTAAFGLPVIQKMDTREPVVQTIILCPIRELALQITKDMNNFIKNSPRAKVTAVYGGFSIDRQIREIKQGTNIIVGTPGRVKDLIKRKALNLSKIKYVVLDEADEMLDMGFKEDLDAILSETPATKQTLLFSATMPATVRRIANIYMKDPVEIKTGTENKGAENVTHEYYMVQSRDRYEALRRILDALPDVYGILFCRTRRETQEVASKLVRDHYKAGAIHGDIPQAQRTRIMDSFRRKEVKLLVATDVAARGIDVKGLSHIINYNLPDTDETYIHRSGRTGRANSEGISISIINTREGRRMRDIARKVGKEFEQKLVPTGKEICGGQLLTIIEKITKTEVDEAEIADYLPIVNEKFKDFDKEQLIKHVVSMEFKYFLDLYKNSNDLNTKTGPSDGGARKAKMASNFAAFKINFGRKDNFQVKDLLQLMNSKSELRGVEIGNIQLEQGISYFEIDERYESMLPKLFNKSNYKARPISLEKVSSMPPRTRKSYGGPSSGGRNSGSRYAGSSSGRSYGGRSSGSRSSGSRYSKSSGGKSSGGRSSRSTSSRSSRPSSSKYKFTGKRR
jgi:ATP-dependent RNA helicase DeaD